ncbi:kinesin-like protein KIN-14I [Cicer arietinum]|uniref:Kinesin-like protein KIN-14I n=1 Tax=Cicer arietinum TaxID=3827 RepID=A0A1S2Z5M5_CICAR|nr:kinesin-like protein KIN-14I [Cicer arietinum]
MVGVVAAKHLPVETYKEEFRLCLRSGIILCNVLNKVQLGDVFNVGESLSAFQYFENVRNFLVAVQEIRIPTFEEFDMEQAVRKIDAHKEGNDKLEKRVEELMWGL